MANVVEPLWRFALTDLGSSIVTILDRLARNRTVNVGIGQARSASGEVRSDNPRVNRVYDGDGNGNPVLSENDRLLYGLRLEDTGVYECRFGGIVHIIEDAAGTEAPTSRFTAFDPRKLLERRPVTHDDGTLPVNEWSFTGKRGNQLALELLQNTHAFHGTTHIDFGQTAFYGGTIETTDVLPDGTGFDQATSVAEAWTQLEDTGTLDIVLTPVYDPLNRPGIVAEFNVFALAGTERDDVIFAWDRPGRSLVGLSHMRDGTEMANKIQYYGSDGKLGGALQTDPASVAAYGQYWMQASAPGSQPARAAVELLAVAELLLRRRGKESLTLSPAPGRAKWPLRDYDAGDSVPVYSSSDLREVVTGLHRLYAIPITIGDEGTERVENMLATPPEIP